MLPPHRTFSLFDFVLAVTSVTPALCVRVVVLQRVQTSGRDLMGRGKGRRSGFNQWAEQAGEVGNDDGARAKCPSVAPDA